MIFVVGSGPAGVSVAAAISRNGHQVTMLDAGLELEPHRRQIVHQLGAHQPKDWDPAAVATLKENFQATRAGIPLKQSYGSDFPYRETDRFLPRQAANIGILPSLARGGLSNVWGAAVLPYSLYDLVDWPITHEQLVPHYRSVLSFMRLSAVDDDLAHTFPLFSDHLAPLPASRQAAELLADMDRHREALRSLGVWFGTSRLAMNGSGATRDACASCGMCMYGCPYGLIYNAANTVDQLLAQEAFTYRGGIVVERSPKSAMRCGSRPGPSTMDGPSLSKERPCSWRLARSPARSCFWIRSKRTTTH